MEKPVPDKCCGEEPRFRKDLAINSPYIMFSFICPKCGRKCSERNKNDLTYKWNEKENNGKRNRTV